MTWSSVFSVTQRSRNPSVSASVATARTGDDVNPKRDSSGSQFYICLGPQPNLDGQYTVFGGVIKGMDAVDQIKKGDHMKKITLAKEPPK